MGDGPGFVLRCLRLASVEGRRPGFALPGDFLFDSAKKEAKSAFLPAGRESYRSVRGFLYGYLLQGRTRLPAAQIARGNAGNRAVLRTS